MPNTLITMIPEQPIAMIEKYGFTAVALVVLGIFSWILVKYILNKFTVHEEKMDEIINRLLDEKGGKPDSTLNAEKLINFAQHASKIQQLTYHLLNELEADRVSIFEFHNGGKTITGVDFKKCSNTYEAVELGIEPKYKDFQNIPISTNFLWNKLLLDKKTIAICDISDLQNTDNTNIQYYYHKEFNLITLN